MTGAVLVTEQVTYRGVRPATTPKDAFRGGLVGLLDRVARVLSGVGVILLDRWAAGQLGLPVDVLPKGGAGKDHPAAVSARQAGWQVSEIHRWSVFTRDGGTRIAVGLLELVDGPYCPLVNVSWDQDTAARFDAWQKLSGMPWWGDAGDAVCHLIQHTAVLRREGRRIQPIWRTRGAEHTLWSERAYGRVWLQDPPPGRWLLGFDAVRSYLGAMGVTEVCPYPLKHTGRIGFDPKRAGWWLVDSAPWTLPGLPDPRGYRPDGWDGPRPLTTPTLTLLAELAEDGVYGGFQVLDSWTGPAHRGVLRPAADRLRTMWDEAGGLDDAGDRDAIRDAIKTGYHAAHGKWQSPRSDIYRPDWSAALVAKARTNLWRKVHAAWRAGASPAGVSGIDTVWYATDDQDWTPPGFVVAEPTRKLGPKLGEWRRKYVLSTTEKETENVPA